MSRLLNLYCFMDVTADYRICSFLQVPDVCVRERERESWVAGVDSALEDY